MWRKPLRAETVQSLERRDTKARGGRVCLVPLGCFPRIFYFQPEAKLGMLRDEIFDNA